MGKLYVLGNGFDMHYHLQTNTDTFIRYLHKETIYNECTDAFDVMAGYGVLWSDFEEDISYIDLNAIEEENLIGPDYLSDHESDRDGGIYNMENYLNSIYNAIFSALKNMVDAADRVNLPADKNMKFNIDDAIICFNYTSTIEKVAVQLPDKDVLYIHGNAARGSDLILGYNEGKSNYNYRKYSNPEDGDYYCETQAFLIRDFYESLKKKRQNEKLEEYLSSLDVIDEVVVYGHSIGKVDIPYFEQIEAKLNPSRWRVSYYTNDDSVFSNVKCLSFLIIVEFFNW